MTRRWHVSVVLAIVSLNASAWSARGQCYSVEQTGLEASDAAENSRFGESVALSGNTVVIGSPFDEHAAGFWAGSAYVFIRSGSVWTQQAWLTASDAAALDRFGYSLALSDDTAVIGSPFDDHAGGLDAGSAYVFVRSGSVWTQQAWLTASDAAEFSGFGYSIALSGDTLVIGSPYDHHAAGIEAGSAYVFVRSGTVWTQQAWLKASDAAEHSHFGYSVALSGDTVMIGSPFDNHAVGDEAGSAYVFVRSGTVWTQQAWLKASDAAAGDNFGTSVTLSGETTMIGSPRDDHAAGFDAGSAYVFVRSGTVWTQQAWLKPTVAVASGLFGESVAHSGNSVLIGSLYGDHGTGLNTGSAYTFVRSGTVWTEEAKLFASNAVSLDQFGESVALSGDTVVIGSPYVDLAGGGNAGSAYIFELPTATLLPGDIDNNQGVDTGDTALFVNVLLGQDADWLHYLRADIDCSGTVDGSDIALFVTLLLN